MASPPYGYRSGPRIPRVLPLDSTTSTIVVGDIITEATAGYYKQAAAGADTVVGVAMEAATAPSADGGKSILVDVSDQSIYEFPADTGTVTQALVGHLWDVGGAQSCDIDASTDDTLYCVGVDTVANTVFVQLNIRANAT